MYLSAIKVIKNIVKHNESNLFDWIVLYSQRQKDACTFGPQRDKVKKYIGTSFWRWLHITKNMKENG